MKTLYLDLPMGAAGDMLSAALYELLDENEQKNFIDEINKAGIPGVTVCAEKASKCGITGTHFAVKVEGHEEHEEHEHHHHHHSSMAEIEKIIGALKIEQSVKTDIIEVYKLIAAAESSVHGVPVTDIHFHEVGTMDAIADITAVCLLLKKLAPDKICASPVNTGFGHVHCAHGILPVPAPATALLLKGIPVYSGHIEGELCTPTGAALLKHFVTDFGTMPQLKIAGLGYGMGKKDFEAANCVRAVLGEGDDSLEQVVEFTCNLDDISAERISFAMEQLFAAGAIEVYTVPVTMKKSRPGILLCVMCMESDREKILQTIFKHTTTLGIRENISNRYFLDRHIETLQTEFGPVRVKCAQGYGVKRRKFEYEDLAKIAREKGMSIDDVTQRLSEKA